MQEKRVAAAVVVDDLGRFLVTWNGRWSCYAFPMKAVEPEQNVLASLASAAVEEDLGSRLPDATAKELGYLGECGQSGSSGEEKLYRYWAFEVLPGAPLTAGLNPAARIAHPPRWLAYPDLLADAEVSWSTKDIARAFVDNQEVSLAVVTRLSKTETEYLLVWNANYGGYFFPTMRRKQELEPEATARIILRTDFGYPGTILADNVGEAPDVHYSARYGRTRAYRFHICKVALPHLDLNQPSNLLERRLKARGLEWRWLTAGQLQNPPVPVSPTLTAVRASVLQAIPPARRDRPLRQSEGGIALVRRTVAGQTEWLAQWNENWKAFFFVGGHRHANESFRDCVLREVGEELGLSAATDFQVANVPVADLRYVAFSQSAGVETDYHMQLFEVKLVEGEAAQRVDAEARNRWLTEREICRLEALDGRPISVTVPMLLTQAKLLNWQ